MKKLLLVALLVLGLASCDTPSVVYTTTTVRPYAYYYYEPYYLRPPVIHRPHMHYTPPATHYRPPVTTRRPPVTNHRPPTTPHRPSTGRPSTGHHFNHR